MSDEQQSGTVSVDAIEYVGLLADLSRAGALIEEMAAQLTVANALIVSQESSIANYHLMLQTMLDKQPDVIGTINFQDAVRRFEEQSPDMEQ